MPRHENPAPSDRRRRVQSAEVGMTVLKALARLGGAASLTTIAQQVGESTAKIHRYLASLMQEELVAQNPATQHYYLGGAAVQIGLAALRQCDPVRLGEVALLRLRDELQVTCFIAVMGNRGPTVMRIEEPALPVTVNTRAGSVMPLLTSATGRAFIGFSGDPAVERMAREEMGAENTLQALRTLARQQGCATVTDSLQQGISAVAAPIHDAHGHVSAVLTALGASNGFDARPTGPIALAIMREARAISQSLGWTG